MAHIFISYSKKNRTYARHLADHLLAQGFDVWIDDRIDYGDNWERVIFRAIDQCAALVVLMTPESYDSDWVLREVQYADRRGKPTFPVLLSGEVFPRFGPTQYVDVSDGSLPPEDFTGRLTRHVPRKVGSGSDVAPHNAPEPAPPAAPAAPPSTIRPGLNPMMVLLGVALVAVVLVGALLLQGQGGGGPGLTATDTAESVALDPTATDTDLPAAATASLPPTDTDLPPSATASLTPTPTRAPPTQATPPGRFLEGQTIRIAWQSPLSGPQSTLGVTVRNGAQLAFEQLAGPLRDLGAAVELIYFDDQATPEVGEDNAATIVADSSMLAVAGHINSRVAIPASEIYNEAGLGYVGAAVTNVAVTDRGLATVNRVSSRDDDQGAAAAQFALDMVGAKTVYILHDDSAYGLSIAERFSDAADARGLRILGFDQVDSDEIDFSVIVTSILLQSPDLIYFSGIYTQAGPFIAQARAAGYTGAFMGPDSFDSPEFITLAGVAGLGTDYTSNIQMLPVLLGGTAFAADYRAVFGEDPGPMAAEGYDAVGVALRGIYEAAVQAGRLPTRDEVAAAIRATTDYPGITGTFSFDDQGDRDPASYYLVRVVSVDPALWNENTVITRIEVPR